MTQTKHSDFFARLSDDMARSEALRQEDKAHYPKMHDLLHCRHIITLQELRAAWQEIGAPTTTRPLPVPTSNGANLIRCLMQDFADIDQETTRTMLCYVVRGEEIIGHFDAVLWKGQPERTQRDVHKLLSHHLPQQQGHTHPNHLKAADRLVILIYNLYADEIGKTMKEHSRTYRVE